MPSPDHDQMTDDARLGRAVRTVAILTGVWTVPVIIGTAAHYFGSMSYEGMPLSHSFGDSLALWYPWILATLAIVRIDRRLPFSWRRWPAAVPAHLVVLAALFVVQTWLAVVIGHSTGHVLMGFIDHARMRPLDLLLYDAFVYAAVIAVAHGLDYARRYRERDLHASQLETQLERSRLEALQMQLQPHFLFNALNSIAMLVRRDRKQEALDVVIGFSELLRYVLDEAGTIDVALREEIHFVRRYLEIERIRYGERLRVSIAVTPDAERALAPNLVLQPLVENALKHGIGRLTEGGEIRIVAERRGALLHIRVENDGPPLDGDFSLDATEGVGLRNLHDRLEAQVDKGGVLRLSNALSPATGVVAEIEIPYRAVRAPAAAPALERVG